jgi:hypothetical protein
MLAVLRILFQPYFPDIKIIAAILSADYSDAVAG